MSAKRERLGALCDQITRHPDMDGEIRKAGVGAQLDEVLNALRDPGGGDPKRLVELLNEIEDGCARSGLAGVTTVSKSFALPPGLRGRSGVSGLVVGSGQVEGVGGSGGSEEPPVWVCPLRSCARTVFHDESAAAPVCVAGGGLPMAQMSVGR